MGQGTEERHTAEVAGGLAGHQACAPCCSGALLPGRSACTLPLARMSSGSTPPRPASPPTPSTRWGIPPLGARCSPSRAPPACMCFWPRCQGTARLALRLSKHACMHACTLAGEAHAGPHRRRRRQVSCGANEAPLGTGPANAAGPPCPASATARSEGSGAAAEPPSLSPSGPGAEPAASDLQDAPEEPRCDQGCESPMQPWPLCFCLYVTARVLAGRVALCGLKTGWGSRRGWAQLFAFTESKMGG